jgi:signal transduction histidine kinase
MTKSSAISPEREFPAGNSHHVDDAIRLVHIIDDDAALGAALTAGLEAHGYRVNFSSSADTGWKAAHQQNPDLILCDINMPGKNGHRLLQEIRQDQEIGNCPFIFMTGNPYFADPRVAMNLGADDFLLKPFSLDTLVACVAARLRRSDIAGHVESDLVAHLKDNLRRGLPHEFFTPLTGIMGFAEMLDQDGDLMNRAEQKEALRNILMSGRRLQRTLRNYLYALDRLAPDSDAPFPVLSAPSVEQLMKHAAQSASDRHGRRSDLVLSISAEPLMGGAHELNLLVEELVDNAFSFSSPETTVEVRASRVGEEFHLLVRDHGRGMTRAQIKSLGLFRQFERNKYEQQGLGVGLFIAHQVLRRFGGKIHFESAKGEGTTCHVTLPSPADLTAKT